MLNDVKSKRKTAAGNMGFAIAEVPFFTDKIGKVEGQFYE